MRLPKFVTSFGYTPWSEDRKCREGDDRSYVPYNKSTASTEDRVAWDLCQIIDDDAPLQWTRYRAAALCIAKNPELMADLQRLSKEPA